MGPEVVYSGVSDDVVVQGGLFHGIKFWLSRRVPQRSRFVYEVQANGGEVLPLENQADIKIVDHLKKEALPGTFSYTYIEQSIRNGTLENLDDHVVGPPLGIVRSVGSISRPAKTQRTPFTEGDDQILGNWVHGCQQNGGSINGNEIYKQLEATNPRHPWQSWRDRYRTHPRFRQPASFAVSHARPADTSNQPLIIIEPKTPRKEAIEKLKRTQDFSKEEVIALYDRGEDILKIAPDNVEDAWEEWILELDPDQNHSVSEWQEFWEKEIRPKYLARNPRKATMPPSSSKKIPSSVPSRSPSFSVKSRSGSVSNSPGSSESQDNFYHSLEIQEQDHDPFKFEPEVFEEMPSSSPPVSMKRKHEASEDDYLSKKRRQQTTSPPIEIASTPDQSPVPNHTVASPETGEDKHLRTVDEIFDEMRQNEIDESSDQESTQDINGVFGKQASPILSEPDNIAGTTQAIFQDLTQSIDLDVPPPEESWDMKEEEEEEEEEAPENTVSELQSQIMDTQGLSGATKGPDLSMPEPDGGWTSGFRPSSPETPDTPPAEDVDQAEINARLDAWIDGQVATGRSADEAISALECTSLDHFLADEVLKYMETHQKRIPPKWRGVWTVEDDKDLESPDARRILRAEEKHGTKLVKLRWDFLAAYRK